MELRVDAPSNDEASVTDATSRHRRRWRSGGEVLSFWNKKNNLHKNHAELACLAILSQQQAVLRLLREWAPTIPDSEHLKCTFGAYTGK
eukprot:3783191-Rhodomonas_salina.1